MNGTDKDILPWERELSRIMCQGTVKDSEQQKMMDEALAIIREVTVDSDGKQILSPEAFVEKTKDMTQQERHDFARELTQEVKDPKTGLIHPIPKSLVTNIQWMLDMGVRPYNVSSGRMADRPNFRDDKGIHRYFNGVGRPFAFIMFNLQAKPGTFAYSCNAKNMEDIIRAAKETGWCVNKLDKRNVMLTLPVTKDGKIGASDLIKEACRRLSVQGEDKDKNIREQAKMIILGHGGRKMWTDAQIGHAWSRLATAIVNNTEQRRAQENGRISDVQIIKVLDKVRQTAVHRIRCRIDGHMQLLTDMMKTDGGRFDMAVYRKNDKATEELKTELARTYFQDELYQEQMTAKMKR